MDKLVSDVRAIASEVQDVMDCLDRHEGHLQQFHRRAREFSSALQALDVKLARIQASLDRLNIYLTTSPPAPPPQPSADWN